MKSATGKHYPALDHIRALAALSVFVWHFSHGKNGYPTPFESNPVWGIFSILDEGHTGVSLFMCLSGYLFAKLLNGKKINYPLFLYNRVLRLFPLLLVVFAIRAIASAVDKGDPRAGYWYLLSLGRGFLYPSWPNGGWSVTSELHFYLILPILLWLAGKSQWLLLAIIGTAATIRGLYFVDHGEVQSIAYWTIFGRIDQFVLGIFAFEIRQFISKRHLIAAIATVALISGYHWFNLSGGFYSHNGYPSQSPTWIWLPTFEGVIYATLIAWYDNSFEFHPNRLSSAAAKVGEYSYSIYLLHFFFVFSMADFVHTKIIDLSSPYASIIAAIICFLAMIPLGYLSMKFVEAPWLRIRKNYIVATESKKTEIP